MMAQDISETSSSEISAQNNRVNEEAMAWLDSVDISLLTCGPGQEVWSYYGHTALRIQDKAHGTDMAVNWGIFSFQQSCFILRFVFGLTDYQVGIFPMSNFMAEYASEGRWVRQQRIRLSRNEKLKILRAIEENNKPENRTYRYNFFYDNCTTRAREMILTNIGNQTNFEDNNTHSTYREEIHKLNGNHRWARFGNDLLLGYEADKELSQRDWEFLPDNLSKDFDTEGRKDFASNTQEIDGTTTASATEGFITLVDSTSYLIQQQAQVIEEDAVTPLKVFVLIGLVIIAATIIEALKKKNFWAFDALLLIITGLPGLILLSMIFSQHPTVQGNFQILILNPLNLIFVWKTIKKMRQGKLYWYYELWGWLLLSALILQIWQTYAEGMEILAFSLLSRYAIKGTRLDLNDSKFGIHKYVVKKLKGKKSE